MNIVNKGKTLLNETEIMASNVNNIILHYTELLMEIVRTQSDDFLQFIFKQNVIQIGIGLLIATQLSILTKLMSDEFFGPIIQKFINNKDKKLEDYKVSVFGIEFKVGLFILNFINFIFVIIFIYFLYKLTQYDKFPLFKQGTTAMNAANRVNNIEIPFKKI